MSTLPSQLTTPRLFFRPWSPGDQSAFEEAVAGSLPHLSAWLPWARIPLEEQWAGLQEFMQRPASAQDVLYAIFDAEETKVLGGIGIHHRGADDEREIGYWLRLEAVGKGYMTEAVRAVTTAVFAALPIAAVTIVCDPANTRSAAVPQRIGFPLAGVFPTKQSVPDRTEDMIWRTTRETWARLHTGTVV